MKENAMPFANLKVPAGLLTPEQKETLVHKVTDLYAETFGDDVRDNTMVLVDEVVDGGWGIRGEVLTLAKLSGN
ncbi:4-oxalocrotonate tautomerase [Actinoplanes friuliensis DSM 7358]|uniref:4-oxalocrotonate tautomerase n=2 Tax=Actinoplanes friuliensis TaxID=196914 RepID=U5WBP7_9ACTN|nr:4-oxalocrotonate tautomerase [Actinoplanes friuliensis DSM 7358]